VILVFAGTGAIIINDVSGGAISHLGVAMTFGLVVMTMIYTLGDISGAHLNPAVSFGFWAARRFPARKLFPYIASQCLGALLASAMLRMLFPPHSTLGTTVPAGSIIQSFALEILLAFFLMFVISPFFSYPSLLTRLTSAFGQAAPTANRGVDSQLPREREALGTRQRFFLSDNGQDSAFSEDPLTTRFCSFEN